MTELLAKHFFMCTPDGWRSWSFTSVPFSRHLPQSRSTPTLPTVLSHAFLCDNVVLSVVPGSAQWGRDVHHMSIRA